MKVNVVNLPLYKVLVKLGADEGLAEAASQHEIIDLARLASCQDIRDLAAEIASLRADLRAGLHRTQQSR